MDKKYGKLMSEAFSHRDFVKKSQDEYNYRQRLIAKYASGKILDIGYANIPNFYLQGDVTGIDIAEVPKPDNYAQVVVGSAYKLPFRACTFDTVTCGELLLHLDNPALCIKEASRVLKPGGRLVLTVINPYYWNTIWTRVIMRETKLFHANHVSELPFYIVETLMRNAGLKPLFKQGTTIGIPFLSRFFRWFRRVPCGSVLLSFQTLYVAEKLEKFEDPKRVHLLNKIKRSSNANINE